MSAQAPQIFDRGLVRQHRQRAAKTGVEHILGKIVAEEILDRLSVVQRRFTRALIVGPVPSLAEAIGRSVPFSVAADLAPGRRPGLVVAADDEAIPFREETFDLIVSALSLHWVNDLPGALIQLRRSLKPDGLFLGALLGGDTLRELRTALSSAEIETRGGLSPRFSPSIDIRDAGALLQRAGFALPVVDMDRVTLDFASPFKLMEALRVSGETNALSERSPRALPLRTVSRMTELYATEFASKSGGVSASFELIHLTGWAPHESQQKPLAPGSARQRLSDALRTQERSAGEKTGPTKP